MTPKALIHSLDVKFKGKQLIDVVDEITFMAKQHGYAVSVIGGRYNGVNIVEEPRRLNIRVDAAEAITSFTIG